MKVKRMKTFDCSCDSNVESASACVLCHCEYKNSFPLMRCSKLTSRQWIAISCEDTRHHCSVRHRIHQNAYKFKKYPKMDQRKAKITCDKNESNSMSDTKMMGGIAAETFTAKKNEHGEQKRQQNTVAYGFPTMVVRRCLLQRKIKTKKRLPKATAKNKQVEKKQIITFSTNIICEDQENKKLVYFEYNESCERVEFSERNAKSGATKSEKILNPEVENTNSVAIRTETMRSITLPQKYFLIVIFVLSLLGTPSFGGNSQQRMPPPEIAFQNNEYINNIAKATVVSHSSQSQPRTSQLLQHRNISKQYQIAINTATTIVTSNSLYANDHDFTTSAAAGNTHFFKFIKCNNNRSKISHEGGDYSRNVPTSLKLFNNIIYKHNPKATEQPQPNSTSKTTNHMEVQKSKSYTERNKSSIKFTQHEHQQKHLRNMKKAKNKIKHGHVYADTEHSMNHNGDNDDNHSSTPNDVDVDGQSAGSDDGALAVSRAYGYNDDIGYFGEATASDANANDILDADDHNNASDNEFEQPNRFTNHIDNQKLMQLVMDGLGLQNLPNMQKVNISQQEYANKYREYLQRVHNRKRRELLEEIMQNRSQYLDFDSPHNPLSILSISMNDAHLERQKRDMEITAGNFSQRSAKLDNPQQRKEKTRIHLHFPLNLDSFELMPDDIEEANIRLMLIHSLSLALKKNANNPKRRCGSGSGMAGRQNVIKSSGISKHVLNLKVYQILNKGKRLWLDGRKIDIEVDQHAGDTSISQWLQFDVTKAVESWLTKRQSNLGLEIQCDNCQRIGARILSDVSSGSSYESESSDVGNDDEDENLQLMPVLNIIGRFGAKHHETRAQSQREDYHSGASREFHHRTNSGNRKQGSKHKCHKTNQRCCRHTMEVVFKEIKGFEFILHPKVFDAGYCHGRCPPRFNPAHHHAMLQSLIWKQSKSKAPRPCCAPSKLVALEVLHVDEKDSSNLKISTWADMQVVKCACS